MKTFMCSVVALVFLSTALPVQAAQSSEKSPHVEALGLVFSAQRDEIDAIERRFGGATEDGERNWWFDTAERQWTVLRPIEPGSIDTTHFFLVEYRIEGKVVASWSVDTKKKTVQRSKAAEPGATDNPDDAQRSREDH